MYLRADQGMHGLHPIDCLAANRYRVLGCAPMYCLTASCRSTHANRYRCLVVAALYRLAANRYS